MGENSGKGGGASKIYGRLLIFIKSGEWAARRGGTEDLKPLVASGLRLATRPWRERCRRGRAGDFLPQRREDRDGARRRRRFFLTADELRWTQMKNTDKD